MVITYSKRVSLWLGSIEPPCHQQDLPQRFAYLHHQFLQAGWLYNLSTS